MDYVVCPHDSERLKVLPGQPAGSKELVVNCPSCGRRFLFDGGLRPLPPDDDPSEPTAAS